MIYLVQSITLRELIKLVPFVSGISYHKFEVQDTKGFKSMKEIPLTRGKVALVSDEDYEELSKYTWQAQLTTKEHIYATRRANIGVNKYKTVWMHRIIANTPDGFVTDHIDGNGLNNQRENLRVCTQAQNMWNRRANSNNTSGYKGIYWYKTSNKWAALISVNKNYMYLGMYPTKEEAYKVYCDAAEKYYGEFSNHLSIKK